jgi:hypothetical protein
LAITYQWQRCNLTAEPSSCVNIEKANAVEYLLQLLDVGHTMRVVVSATNSRGSVSMPSKITGLIEGLLLSPTAGAPGTSVVLKGAGVSAASTVNFGAQPVEPEVKSANEITATVPAGSGTVPVTVSTPEGSTGETPKDQFTYR